jgi:hypothetical protein
MPVDIYTDESVPTVIADGLKRRGVTAISARDAGNLELTDSEQLAYAAANHLLLFTHDTDFIHLAYLRNASSLDHWGVIYVHQNKLSVGECIRRLQRIAKRFDQDYFKNRVEYLSSQSYHSSE